LRPNLPLPPPIAAIFKTMDKVVIQNMFGGLDRETSIAAYRANDAKVSATIPADRLLVFTPADGWTPLCKFLGVAVPDTPVPKKQCP
jgi:Sulfotransferase domain